ncbi:hypothetical protein GS891_04635 [Rhodococcus hoagii]|nr:hypothetical protein [Prescottella equi]
MGGDEESTPTCGGRHQVRILGSGHRHVVRGACGGHRRGPRGEDARRCEECAALGEQNWAHLRMCLTCGHVGCCDSSPHRHATAHFAQTGHPVMRSHEPGETWRWCYRHAEMG